MSSSTKWRPLFTFLVIAILLGFEIETAGARKSSGGVGSGGGGGDDAVSKTVETIIIICSVISGIIMFLCICCYIKKKAKGRTTSNTPQARGSLNPASGHLPSRPESNQRHQRSGGALFSVRGSFSEYHPKAQQLDSAPPPYSQVVYLPDKGNNKY
ncbi:hypothetical protein RRG08_043305 [Elysia crispata]|uniref:Transmembrane protein n=1 Tax=Elysia crispata TaxID=231223 RepID=A0AAE0XY36_9GAST|nr:hypothetical protein RRG08_043305 [Elysia crispata]